MVRGRPITAALCALLFIGAAHAGELGIECGPSPTPQVQYRVYSRPPLGEWTVVGETDTARRLIVQAPDGCVPREYSCTAFVGDRESARSPAVTSAARPVVHEVLVTTDGLRQVIGANFTPGATLALDGQPAAAVVESCEVMTTADQRPFATLTVTVGTLRPASYTIPVVPPSGVAVD
jgi:hypothetical protein